MSIKAAVSDPARLSSERCVETLEQAPDEKFTPSGNNAG
jgi:hypothetical protein